MSAHYGPLTCLVPIPQAAQAKHTFAFPSPNYLCVLPLTPFCLFAEKLGPNIHCHQRPRPHIDPLCQTPDLP
eukprot:1150799-Pelagomonas_calceolata.AAC.11